MLNPVQNAIGTLLLSLLSNACYSHKGLSEVRDYDASLSYHNAYLHFLVHLSMSNEFSGIKYEKLTFTI